ncbi:MAG: B12-binding domain-containing radical SAM protein [Halanaerobiales bacterium]
MKALLTTLNSKYIHSSLALRYIEKYCSKHLKNASVELQVKEFSINEQLDQIMAEIYKVEAELIAFSCYIWNRDMTFELMDRLKKVKPEVTIIAGGPEVSYDAVTLMKDKPFLDIIIKGEGEPVFKDLLDSYQNIGTNKSSLSGVEGISRREKSLSSVHGIVYRNDSGDIVETAERALMIDLDSIPRPYTEIDLEKLKHKLIYYEASRGCPYNCSYCLSSTIKGVRSFSLDRVKSDLMFFIDNNVKQVKFVDRTFNYDKKRTREIFKFLLENKKETSFHFEITADLLDDEILDLLRDVPDGLFQFEIGVQTTNKNTLHLIGRKVNFDLLAENVRVLKDYNNINLHLDLIAGLPGESYESFKQSFNNVYDLKPDVLQLGFLKLLRGSRSRDEAEIYGYKYTSQPPYEVLQNQDISYKELLLLKDIEFILDKYYNAGVFNSALDYIFKHHYDSYFSFYEDFARYFVAENLHRRSHSRVALYRILHDFYIRKISSDKQQVEFFKEVLKYDLIKYNPGQRIPDWALEIKSGNFFNDMRYNFLDNEEYVKMYLPSLKDRRVKDILKYAHFDFFYYDLSENSSSEERLNIREKKKTVILFDYSNKDKPRTYNVTDYFDLG